MLGSLNCPAPRMLLGNDTGEGGGHVRRGCCSRSEWMDTRRTWHGTALLVSPCRQCAASHSEKLEPLPGFYWVNRRCYQFTSEMSSSNNQLKDTWVPSQSRLSRPDWKGLCRNENGVPWFQCHTCGLSDSLLGRCMAPYLLTSRPYRNL